MQVKHMGKTWQILVIVILVIIVGAVLLALRLMSGALL